MNRPKRGWNPALLILIAAGLIILLVAIMINRVLGFGATSPDAAWIDSLAQLVLILN